MTEIKVLLDENPSSIGNLSDIERELLFENIAARNPGISKTNINSFMHMQSLTIKKELRENKSYLKELLLRKIISLSHNYNSEFNTLVIPIIISPFVENYLKKTDPDVKNTSNTIIKISFDTCIYSVTQKGIDYIVPSNEEIYVTGIIVNPICTTPKTIKNNQLTELTAVKITKDDIKDNILLGNCDYVKISANCDNIIERPNNNITVGDVSYSDSIKILFDDVPDLSKVLLDIFNYIIDHERYNSSLESAQLVYAKIQSALRGDNTPLAKFIANNTIQHNVLETIVNPPKSDIFKMLETIHRGVFNTTYALNTISDIYLRGFASIYITSLLKGKDSPEVVSTINKYKERRIKINLQRVVREKYLIENGKINIYRSIIEKKLGSQKINEIEKQILIKPSLVSMAANILTLLSPHDRKIVEIEYKKHENYLEAVLNNKCEHVRLMKDFRNAKTDENIKKYFHSLQKFFDQHNDSNMITCKICKFDIICPHLLKLTELNLSNARAADIKATLTNYIDRSEARDQFYCKICGELISSSEDFGEIGVSRDLSLDMNEDLKNFMWGEISSIIRYIKFNTIVNVTSVINTIRNTCYPYIYEIEKQILKSKTNNAEEIKSKKKLYTTIYTFAYIIHLITTNNHDELISLKNFTPKNPKNILIEMIKFCIDIIISSRNIIIRDIPGMTSDSIKNNLIDAYKSIRATNNHLIVHSDESVEILGSILIDPIYKYILSMNMINASLVGHRIPKDIAAQIDFVLGDKIQNIEKTNNVFAKAHIPDFTKWDTGNFDSMTDDLFKVSDENKINLNYMVQSFELFYQKITDRLYTEYLYADIHVADKTNLDIELKLRDVHEKHTAKYLLLLDIENRLMARKQIKYVHTYTMLPLLIHQVFDQHNNLGRVYDEEGIEHKWDIYLMKKNNEIKEYKLADINKSTEAGTRSDAQMIDRRCSICKILKSKIDTINNDKIKESIQTNKSIMNFLHYYEYRCPVDELHQFDNFKCVKCGFNATFLTTINEEAKIYYNKYKKLYLSDKNIKKEITKSPVYTDTSSKYVSEYTTWVFNFNVVLDLSNKLKINHKLISVFGATEKQEYSDIVSGVYIPNEAGSRYDTRIYVINSYIKNLITEYNQLKFFNRLTKPSAALSTIIDNSGISKYKIAEIHSKLPNIFKDYNNRFECVQKIKKPREIVDFCIQTLCEMCLEIWNYQNDETKKMRHHFVEYYIKKIIRSDELVSKPGYFNMSILYGDKEDKKDYDPNTSNDNDYNDYNDNNNDNEDDDEAESPMSMEYLDIDKDPDDDPSDDDSNDIKIGDEYGL